MDVMTRDGQGESPEDNLSYHMTSAFIANNVNP